MPTSSRFRAPSRRGRWTGLLLIAALLPALEPGAPAFAAECTSEVGPTSGPPLNMPTGPGCDDIEPPETTMAAVSPRPNAQGWIRQNGVAFTFSGAHNDTDTDPISFQCQFFNTPAPPEEWLPCTSPMSYDELEESAATPYTFRVRAVDTADDGIDLTSDPIFSQGIDQPDVDQTPSQQTVRVDTVDPVALIFDGPYDIEGTGWPIVQKPRVTYRLGSNEAGVSYRCRLDGQREPCDAGRVTFKGLRGGNWTLSVTVTDRAGNTDESASIKRFVVPYNLAQGTDWASRNGRGYFAGDFLGTRRFGATITFRARQIQEFRLIAPGGPGLGRIRVRYGDGRWNTYDLGKGDATTSRFLTVRNRNSPLFTGRVLIQSLSRGEPVRVDALVFPP